MGQTARHKQKQDECAAEANGSRRLLAVANDGARDRLGNTKKHPRYPPVGGQLRDRLRQAIP